METLMTRKRQTMRWTALIVTIGALGVAQASLRGTQKSARDRQKKPAAAQVRVISYDRRIGHGDRNCFANTLFFDARNASQRLASHCAQLRVASNITRSTAWLLSE
jgi:Tfp pilus assembly protein PilV